MYSFMSGKSGMGGMAGKPVVKKAVKKAVKPKAKKK